VSDSPRLEVGDTAPAFNLPDADGKTVKLSDFKGRRVIVYFYPAASTPGCTKQACSLRDSYEALTEKNVRIFGVSADREAGQKAFKEKYKLPFELLADEDAKVIDAFGVPKTLGFAKRQAFLFKDGKLVWSDLSASTEKQAEDVLKFLASEAG
jgi:peroxiredoxin Q/BCP